MAQYLLILVVLKDHSIWILIKAISQKFRQILEESLQEKPESAVVQSKEVSIFLNGEKEKKA